MKILFLANQLDVGGIEKNLLLLAGELTRRGHEVTAATSGGSLVPQLTESGPAHFQLNLNLRPFAFVRDIGRLRRWLRKERPHVIHVFSAKAAALASIGVRTGIGSPRPPIVSSIMGLQNSPSESTVHIRARAFVSSLGADRLIVMAPAIQETVDALRISPTKQWHGSVVGVRLPSAQQIDASRREARAALGVDPEERVVMTIGRLNPSKSHELFIRSAARVMRAREDVRFFIVGEGPLRPSLERLRTELGADRVELLGERTDVERLLSAADLYVRPGIVEGFVGITVLEAQACGVPVISFETRDVKLAVEHGRSGWLVPRGDVEALADAIIELVEDPSKAAALGDGGRRSVEERFSIGRIVDSLDVLYAELVNARGR